MGSQAMGTQVVGGPSKLSPRDGVPVDAAQQIKGFSTLEPQQMEAQNRCLLQKFKDPIATGAPVLLTQP